MSLATALSVVATAALLAGACSGDRTSDGGGAGDALGDGSLGVVEVGPGEAIQIQSVLALSGDAGSGPTSEKVVRLAVDHYGAIHGFDVDLGTPVDDGCSPEGGERAGAEIAADAAVIGVIGTSCSAAAVTAAPLVTGANKVMISPSNTSPRNTSPRLTSDLAGNPSPDHHVGYYRTADNDLHQARTMAQFLRSQKGADAVAAIHNGDAYSQSLAEAFAASFEGLGSSVTGVGVVARDETDPVPTLTDLADGSPEALFFPVSQTVGAAIVQQLPEVTGLDGESLVSDLAGVREYLDGVSGYGGIIGSIACDDFGDCGVRRIAVVEHLDSGNPAATRSNTVYEYTL